MACWSACPKRTLPPAAGICLLLCGQCSPGDNSRRDTNVIGDSIHILGGNYVSQPSWVTCHHSSHTLWACWMWQQILIATNRCYFSILELWSYIILNGKSASSCHTEMSNGHSTFSHPQTCFMASSLFPTESHNQSVRRLGPLEVQSISMGKCDQD